MPRAARPVFAFWRDGWPRKPFCCFGTRQRTNFSWQRAVALTWGGWTDSRHRRRNPRLGRLALPLAEVKEHPLLTDDLGEHAGEHGRLDEIDALIGGRLGVENHAHHCAILGSGPALGDAVAGSYAFIGSVCV